MVNEKGSQSHLPPVVRRDMKTQNSHHQLFIIISYRPLAFNIHFLPICAMCSFAQLLWLSEANFCFTATKDILLSAKGRKKNKCL